MTGPHEHALDSPHRSGGGRHDAFDSLVDERQDEER
jgi:hypothetical protein